MTRSSWRTATTSAVAVTALTTATLIAAPTASAATCKPTPNVLGRPASLTKLAGGATARVWDTGPTRPNPQAATRIVAVEIPAAATLKPRVAAAATLNSAQTPATYLARTPRAVVMVNGGVFNPTRGALPDLPQMTSGRLTKARAVADPAIVTDSAGRSAPARLWVTGAVTVPGAGSRPVTGLNWQTVSGSGVTVYTPAWGKPARPAGTVDVVVVAGKVSAVRTGSARGKAPTAGQTILTGSGSAGTWLRGLRRGAPVAVGYKAATDAKLVPYEAVGRGARYLNRGVKNGGSCAARDELLRPRTAVAWKRNGNLLVVTVSGRATVGGVRYGGATIHQMADYLQRLGAYDATNLDGGGSTTMLARTAAGKVVRLDRGMAEAQRPVPNVFYVS